MKKIVALLLCVIVLSCMLCACVNDNEDGKNSDGTDETEKINPYEDIDITEYVTLGTYKGFELNVKKEQASDTVIDERIKYYIAQLIVTEESDRTVVEDKDTVRIDFTGYIDGEEFENASGEDFDVNIGYTSLISGFEEGLIGHSLNETFNLDLVFPEDYTEDEEYLYLNGKPVTFSITIKSISDSVIPTEEETASEYGYDSFQEFYNAVKEACESYYNSLYETDMRNAILDYIMDHCEKLEVPTAIYEDNYATLMSTYSTYATSYNSYYGTNFTWQEYFKYSSGYEPEEYCNRQIKTEMILLLICDLEKLEMTDEFYDEEIAAAIEYYSSSSYTSYTEEEFVELYGEDFLRYQFMFDYVVDWLKDNVTNTAIEG